MKKYLLYLFLFSSIPAFSQTNLTLEINHKLNGEEFEFLQTGINNLEQEFTIDRLEYYLSNFKITHDNGQETSFTDVYALIRANESETVTLGELDATTIEQISFNVGVDEANNHADPSAWPPEHPLAPQFPSMHWGWASGYRFLAIEGNESTDNQSFELHGLGNDNYFRVGLPMELEVNSDNTTIHVQANTEEILRGIDLSNGVIVHGDYGDAQTGLLNMKDYVFEITNATLSSNENTTDLLFDIFPNPVNTDKVQLNFSSRTGETYRLSVSDLQGRKVLKKNQVNTGTQIELGSLNPGIYLFNLSSDKSYHSSTRKLIVK